MNSPTTLTILAREYEEEARRLRKWIKSQEGVSDDPVSRRRLFMAKQMLREAVSISKYLEVYYGDINKSTYYRESLIVVRNTEA